MDLTLWTMPYALKGEQQQQSSRSLTFECLSYSGIGTGVYRTTAAPLAECAAAARSVVDAAAAADSVAGTLAAAAAIPVVVK